MSSDVDRLLAWFHDGSLTRPDAASPGTVHLGRALASLAGSAKTELAPPAQQIASAIDNSDHYVFVLVDGLGLNILNRLPASRFFRSHVAMELQAVFPSSTAPALTALATGCWPAQHAVTGWWTYLPDHHLTTTILPFVERFDQKSLLDRGITAAAVFPSRSLFADLHSPASWTPAPIADSVYSRYFTGGVPASGYTQLGDACAEVAARIASAKAQTYTYLYVSQVDNTEHEHGPDSADALTVLEEVERRIEQLARALVGRARIIISADHGQIGVPTSAQITLAADDSLMRWLRVPPTGDYRSLIFHARDGHAADFASAFRDRFGAAWALLTAGEVDELRLFGPEPLATETRRRIGDFVAVGPGADAIRYVPEETPMLGYHGGLHPDEMRIPLILA